MGCLPVLLLPVVVLPCLDEAYGSECVYRFVSPAAMRLLSFVCVYHRCSPAQHCFYNVRGCPAVHCLADNSASWLVCADTLPDVTRLERSLSSYWNRLRLERPDVIEGDCLLPEISVRNKTVFYAGKRICLLYDDRWGNKISGVPVSIDYLYVSHGYKGDMQELVSLFEVGTVVIDASLSEYYRERIISDCVRLGIPYLPLSEKVLCTYYYKS